MKINTLNAFKIFTITTMYQYSYCKDNPNFICKNVLPIIDITTLTLGMYTSLTNFESAYSLSKTVASIVIAIKNDLMITYRDNDLSYKNTFREVNKFLCTFDSNMDHFTCNVVAEMGNDYIFDENRFSLKRSYLGSTLNNVGKQMHEIDHESVPLHFAAEIVKQVTMGMLSNTDSDI